MHACTLAVRNTGEVTRRYYAQLLRHAQFTQSTKPLHNALLDENEWQEVVNWLAKELFHPIGQGRRLGTAPQPAGLL